MAFVYGDYTAALTRTVEQLRGLPMEEVTQLLVNIHRNAVWEDEHDKSYQYNTTKAYALYHEDYCKDGRAIVLYHGKNKRVIVCLTDRYVCGRVMGNRMYTIDPRILIRDVKIRFLL